MNFLHLSFEDFFAYKLKFLSDIARPFNERLLALAPQKLRRSRWSTCTPDRGDAWIQSQKCEFYKMLYGDLSSEVVSPWLIHSSNIIMPTRRKGRGKETVKRGAAEIERDYSTILYTKSIFRSLFKQHWRTSRNTALVNFTFTIAILLRDLLHFLGKDIESITVHSLKYGLSHVR